jgi:anti-sigma regulatory factor (Ser/Thr protein kinase)
MAPTGFGPALDATIECTQHAPSEARRAVGELAPDVDTALVRDVQLLVSELVTNSVRHSGSNDPIRLRVWERRDGLKVEITDGGRGFEGAPGGAGDESEGGRGLMILEALAASWGVSRGTRACVWFELTPRPVSSSARTG